MEGMEDFFEPLESGIERLYKKGETLSHGDAEVREACKNRLIDFYLEIQTQVNELKGAACRRKVRSVLVGVETTEMIKAFRENLRGEPIVEELPRRGERKRKSANS